MQVKRINLALQGGGAHGAYTWGVLDRLLEDERLEVEAISGTSAGAMNAAVFADGMGRGGRDEAKRALDAFWANISQASQVGPLQPSPFDQFASGWNLDHSAAFVAFDMLTRMLSPYQLNPMNLNPARCAREVGRLQAPRDMPGGETLHQRDQREDRQDPGLHLG